MRVLVAGGAGFIGCWLCEALLERGDEVICVDNYVTGTTENIQHLEGMERFQTVRHDICEPFQPDASVDAVFNLASPASPVDYFRLPLETMRVGSMGTENLLKIAEACSARYLQASTSEVYGDPDIHPQREEYTGNVNPIGPRAVYDEAKRYGEAIVSSYRRDRSLSTTIVRIFNTYGPRMRLRDGRVIPALGTQALRGEPLTVHGEGQQTRSFCFVSDMVAGLIRAMDADHPGPINLGNPGEYTILELARIIVELTGSSSEIRFEPRLEDDPRRRCPDISRAQQLLGWEPKVPLAEGLKITLDDFAARD